PPVGGGPVCGECMAAGARVRCDGSGFGLDGPRHPGRGAAGRRSVAGGAIPAGAMVWRGRGTRACCRGGSRRRSYRRRPDRAAYAAGRLVGRERAGVPRIRLAIAARRGRACGCTRRAFLMPSVRPVCLILVVVAAACRNFGEPATTLAVSPPTLAFTAPIGGVGPPQQLLTVDRRGSGRLQWDATSDAPWLAIAPAQDTAPATAWVTAALQNLSIGTHHGHIVVVAGADTSLVAVTFLVA